MLNNFKKTFSNISKCLKLNARIYSNKPSQITGPGLESFMKIQPNILKIALNDIPYVNEETLNGHNKKVYGCPMNFNDAEIAWSILKQYNYSRVLSISDADIILLVTCSIREKAEDAIWKKLSFLNYLKKRRTLAALNLKVGILGCMAERLREKIFEKEKIVDIIAGPDSYKDLPRLLACANQEIVENKTQDSYIKMANVLLSLDETYADVLPARFDNESPTAFVSIMRGCNNLCSFCVVPFTRGREKNRPLHTIIDEITFLTKHGVKEITLLGQNVNSYHYLPMTTLENLPLKGMNESKALINDCKTTNHMTPGFRLNYRKSQKSLNLYHSDQCIRFPDLLDKIANTFPHMRIRFTSPHPKDFPEQLLHVIQKHPNVCKQIHLPLQSGSCKILESMRRGHTRQAYLDLVAQIRAIIPNVSLTTDVISGFCGEHEADHDLTLDVIKRSGFTRVYHYAYSPREQTRAYKTLSDDVPAEVKKRRLREIIELSLEVAQQINASLVGIRQLVLVEKTSKRSDEELMGRCDNGTIVIFPKLEIPALSHTKDITYKIPKIGDFVAVDIQSCSSLVLKGSPIFITSLQSFYKFQNYPDQGKN